MTAWCWRPSAGALLTACLAAWAALAAATSPPAAGPAQGAAAAVYPADPQETDKLAASDPLALLRLALKWCDERVLEYTCQFYKHEKIEGKIQKPETMRMKFRANTFSVYLKWTGDVSPGQEIIYVEGRNDGKVAVHPSGILGVLFRRVNLDPTGKIAMRHSRRPVTFAGMVNMLRLVISQCEKARANGDLVLTYEGIRDHDGRPAYVFKRVLPHKHDYPCPVLIIYIDRQTLICPRTDAYDWDGTLLSRYIYTDIKINPGLTDEDFNPDNRDYGFRLF